MHAAMEDLKYGINVHNGSSEKMWNKVTNNLTNLI